MKNAGITCESPSVGSRGVIHPITCRVLISGTSIVRANSCVHAPGHKTSSRARCVTPPAVTSTYSPRSRHSWTASPSRRTAPFRCASSSIAQIARSGRTNPAWGSNRNSSIGSEQFANAGNRSPIFEGLIDSIAIPCNCEECFTPAITSLECTPPYRTPHR